MGLPAHANEIPIHVRGKPIGIHATSRPDSRLCADLIVLINSVELRRACGGASLTGTGEAGTGVSRRQDQFGFSVDSPGTWR